MCNSRISSASRDPTRYVYLASKSISSTRFAFLSKSGRCCEHFPDGFDPHLLHPGEQAQRYLEASGRVTHPHTHTLTHSHTHTLAHSHTHTPTHSHTHTLTHSHTHTLTHSHTHTLTETHSARLPGENAAIRGRGSKPVPRQLGAVWGVDASVWAVDPIPNTLCPRIQ